MVEAYRSILPYESLTMSTQIKERPILFSGAMVRALLDGSKTQTRREVKMPPSWDCFVCADWSGGWWPYRSDDGESPTYDNNEIPLNCPYGQPGDRLWVRETWAPHPDFPTCVRRPVYRADPECKYDVERWRPSIHMPRWASRILIEVVSVRVERLSDCSQMDAIAEGAVSIRSQAWDREHFPAWRYLFDEAVAAGAKPPIGPTPVQAYQALWDSINGTGSWDTDPWVWVVEFKRVRP